MRGKEGKFVVIMMGMVRDEEDVEW